MRVVRLADNRYEALVALVEQAAIEAEAEGKNELRDFLDSLLVDIDAAEEA